MPRDMTPEEKQEFYDKLWEMVEAEEASQQAEQQAQQEPAQTQPPQYPEPSYHETTPRPAHSFTPSERRTIHILARKMAEKKGGSVETWEAILEEIFNEDRKILSTVAQFSNIKRSLATGEISGRMADVEGARLIRGLGARLARKIDSGELSFDDLLKFMVFKMLYDSLKEDTRRSEEETPRYVTYRIPMVDPATGEVVRDANGNPVMIEYVAPPGSVPMPYMYGMMGQRQSKREEELRKEIDNLRNELRRLLEEKEKEELKQKIDSLMNKIKDLETRVTELKNSGGGGEGAGSLTEAIKELESMAHLLEQLGWKVEKPGERSAGESLEKAELDLKKMRLELEKELLGNHIGPAIAEIIKNPERIVRFLNGLRAFFTGLGGQQAPQPQAAPVQAAPIQAAPSPPPKLESLIREVEAGGRGEG